MLGLALGRAEIGQDRAYLIITNPKTDTRSKVGNARAIGMIAWVLNFVKFRLACYLNLLT
jgi:hypothetical protein